MEELLKQLLTKMDRIETKVDNLIQETDNYSLEKSDFNKNVAKLNAIEVDVKILKKIIANS